MLEGVSTAKDTFYIRTIPTQKDVVLDWHLFEEQKKAQSTSINQRQQLQRALQALTPGGGGSITESSIQDYLLLTKKHAFDEDC